MFAPNTADISDDRSDFAARAMKRNVVAYIGPTNTGKTHRAIERMLEFETGMIGLPLRLLAREVYDRVSVRVGESQVALVTGEEKRIPPRPRYWVATVEAMPAHEPVEFVAVDEVQLVANPERGHVFTDRVLNLRGTKETWLLGSDVVRPWLAEVVGGVEFRSSPRLSTLSAHKPLSLRSVPTRTAIVSFSLPRVFELARALRRHRGGAAVVVGAMSPRTRNAQVAMYEAGEVDFVVATDAIGMGLNLGIDHVAFAEIEKFDGKEVRPLEAAEVAQIAGRAGRYTKNGTFGALAPLEGIPKHIARRVEEHRFSPLPLAMYRSSDLSFDSVEDLLLTLHAPPPHQRMRRVRDVTDERAFEQLATSEVIAPLLTSPDSVRLLWQVASVPDYRQLLLSLHTDKLAEIFVALATQGTLDPGPIGRQLDALAKANDDPEALLDRIADVRFWNYVANQPGWLDPKSGVLDRARGVEDSLSDALHRAVLERFGPVAGHVATKRDPPRAAPSSPFASLALLRRSAADLRPLPFDVDRLVEAPHAAFSIDQANRIVWESHTIGRLVRGRELTLPDAVVVKELGAGARLQVQRRLVAFARDLVGAVLGSIDRSIDLSPSARGILYAVRSGLGTWSRDGVVIADEDVAALDRVGLTVGQFTVYAAALLRPRVVERRSVLVRAFFDLRSGASGPRVPTGKEVSIRADGALPPLAYAALGYLCVGKRAIRADILERLAPDAILDLSGTTVARMLGCAKPEGLAIIAALPASSKS